MFRGKNYKESAKLIDKQALYDPQEALQLVINASKAKFDETVELHVKLGVDGRHADQQVRGAIVLPNGTGKTVRVLVFCPPEQVEEALAAGADYAGGMEYVEKIQKEAWFEFDTVIANPKMMGTVGRLGKILGPKGLMPSPKAARSASAPRSSMRTMSLSSAPSTRPSPLPPRASISVLASPPPPWAPASRSTLRSSCNSAHTARKTPAPSGAGVLLRRTNLNNPKTCNSFVDNLRFVCYTFPTNMGK